MHQALSAARFVKSFRRGRPGNILPFRGYCPFSPEASLDFDIGELHKTLVETKPDIILPVEINYWRILNLAFGLRMAYRPQSTGRRTE